jgi:hypothetical protein
LDVIEKLYNEEVLNLQSSPSTIRMSTSRRMRWEGHLAGMGRSGMLIGFDGKTSRKETTGKTYT